MYMYIERETKKKHVNVNACVQNCIWNEREQKKKKFEKRNTNRKLNSMYFMAIYYKIK